MKKVFVRFCSCYFCAEYRGVAYSGDITPKMNPKIEAYKKKAVEWAANPTIIKAVQESNAKGPIPGMGNAKWRELKENDQ